SENNPKIYLLLMRNICSFFIENHITPVAAQKYVSRNLLTTRITNLLTTSLVICFS
ncbi:hypothetical protein L9F63_023470, partial [Diploptera punctata]